MFVLVILGITSFGALGLVVASVTNTMQETQIINQLLWFALIFLSGATFPLAVLPQVVQRIGAVPAGHLSGQWLAARHGLIDAGVLVPWAWNVVSGCWAALAFFISSQLFRWEPEAKLPRNAKLWAAATILPFVLLGIWENHNGKLLATAAYDDGRTAERRTRRRPRKLSNCSKLARFAEDTRQIGCNFAVR